MGIVKASGSYSKMHCFNKVGAALWWGPSAEREIPKETKQSNKKNDCCGQKRLRNHMRGLLHSLPFYKAALSLVGDHTVGSKGERTVSRPVMHLKPLVTTAVQKT